MGAGWGGPGDVDLAGNEPRGAAADVLEALTRASRWERWRGRGPRWRALHEVPVGAGRTAIDHVLVGPPGVVTVTVRRHRRGPSILDGDVLVVDGSSTAHVPRARREAAVAQHLLAAALRRSGGTGSVVRVRPVIATVGGRLVVSRGASGVEVVAVRHLVRALESLPAELTPAEVDSVFEVARWRSTWAGPPGARERSGRRRG